MEEPTQIVNVILVGPLVPVPTVYEDCLHANAPGTSDVVLHRIAYEEAVLQRNAQLPDCVLVDNACGLSPADVSTKHDFVHAFGDSMLQHFFTPRLGGAAP